MITRVTSIEESKQQVVEMIINKSNKVTKVSNESTLNGISYGVAKVAQKAVKDIALVESHLFPDYAFGTHLDAVAQKLGIAPRFSSTPSSTYVRVVGNVGTTYTAGTHTFTGGGFTFNVDESVIIGQNGWAYVKVSCQTQGSKSNVDPLSITSVSPVPTGHLYCVNEYRADGGRDVENDNDFKLRIKEGANIAATGTTLSKINQVFQKINPNIFRVYYQGLNSSNQAILAVATVSGANLTTTQLATLKDRAKEYLGINEIPILNGVVQLEVKNIEFQPIDISFKVQLESGAVADSVRKRIQQAISKYLDWRYWTVGGKVEWDDLLQIVKDDPQVKYVPDQNFSPNIDIQTDPTKLPRMRGFIMMDMNGTIIESDTGALNPVYYPTSPNLFFQATVLSSI